MKKKRYVIVIAHAIIFLYAITIWLLWLGGVKNYKYIYILSFTTLTNYKFDAILFSTICAFLFIVYDCTMIVLVIIKKLIGASKKFFLREIGNIVLQTILCCEAFIAIYIFIVVYFKA